MAIHVMSWLHELIRRVRLYRMAPSAQRLELAWTIGDRERTWTLALGAAPREGAVLALCRRSTARTRNTLLVQAPIPPEPGDLSYHRGSVVTITSRYLNRAIDAVGRAPSGAGIAVLHTHPGPGVPMWSDDDHRADGELAQFLFGEGFLAAAAPLVSIVVSDDHLRARELVIEPGTSSVAMRSVERVRTLGLGGFQVYRTLEGRTQQPLTVPSFADRSVRAFGREGQRQLADLHVAIVGAGGVGSIVAEHLARFGVGEISLWDHDVVKDVNINRSAVFTFAHARRRTYKAAALARALPGFSLVRNLRLRWSAQDVRSRSQLADLVEADLIVMLVDDARPRHFVNRLGYAHYIPVLDGGNTIHSTGEDDGAAEHARVEAGAVRVSVLMPGGPCLWCAGHLTSEKLSLAYRTQEEVAADRARGYVEHLGPEHAPSVMPVNAMTAALLELRLQDLFFALSAREVAEVHYSLLDGTLDEIPRTARLMCRNCSRVAGFGDQAEMTFAEC